MGMFDTLGGWGASLVDFATGDFASELGETLTFGLVDSELINTMVGDAAMGAVVGGGIAALTGEDVWKGIGYGAAAGGIAGGVMDEQGLGIGSTITDAIRPDTAAKEAGSTSLQSALSDAKKDKDGNIILDKDTLKELAEATTGNAAQDKYEATLASGLLGGIMKYYGDKDKDDKNDDMMDYYRDKLATEERIADKKLEHETELTTLKNDLTKKKFQGVYYPEMSKPTVNPVQLESNVNITPVTAAALQKAGLLDVELDNKQNQSTQ